MRILVTGGAGFVGSHVVDHLVSLSHEVTVLDNLSSGTAANLRTDVPFVRGDIREPLLEVFTKLRPEVVIHLAAQVSVPKSVADPLSDLAANIGGVVNVMEGAAHSGVRKVVSISSAAVYGVPSTLPITEGTPLRALSPYGLSKLTGEAYIRMLGDLRGIAYTIIRPANVYGPRQTTDGEGAVIPAFLDRFLNGRDPVIHGDGSQTRDFVYVTDLARAITLTVNKADGVTLNVSSGIGVTVNALWRELATLLHWRRPPMYGPTRVGDIAHSVMASDLVRQQLSWKPLVSLREGLAETVIWNKATQVAASKGQQ